MTEGEPVSDANKLRIYFSIVRKDRKFAVRMRFGTGELISESPYIFTTRDAAVRVANEFLERTATMLKEKGVKGVKAHRSEET